MKKNCIHEWHYYEQDIISLSASEAYFILSFLRGVQRLGKSYEVTEILDLQRYKLITKKNMVRSMLYLPKRDSVFIFPVCKN